MAWIKKHWDSYDAYLEHHKRRYAIPLSRFLQGVDNLNNVTWFYHLAQKRWIKYDDLLELKLIFAQQYPNIDWDYHLEQALIDNYLPF